MLQMIKGCRINDPSVLNEGYEQIENGFVANVDANHIGPLFESFIRLHNEYCFLILEIPTNATTQPWKMQLHIRNYSVQVEMCTNSIVTNALAKQDWHSKDV